MFSGAVDFHADLPADYITGSFTATPADLPSLLAGKGKLRETEQRISVV